MPYFLNYLAHLIKPLSANIMQLFIWIGFELNMTYSSNHQKMKRCGSIWICLILIVVAEMARQQRHRRKKRQKWIWGSIGLVVTLGAAAIAWSYFPASKPSPPEGNTIDGHEHWNQPNANSHLPQSVHIFSPNRNSL